jgi:hypothetical protein
MATSLLVYECWKRGWSLPTRIQRIGKLERRAENQARDNGSRANDKASVARRDRVCQRCDYRDGVGSRVRQPSYDQLGKRDGRRGGCEPCVNRERRVREASGPPRESLQRNRTCADTATREQRKCKPPGVPQHSHMVVSSDCGLAAAGCLRRHYPLGNRPEMLGRRLGVVPRPHVPRAVSVLLRPVTDQRSQITSEDWAVSGAFAPVVRRRYFAPVTDT